MRFTEFAYGGNPVVSAVIAALMIIIGILVIIYPLLLTWVVGVGLVLGAVALLAATITGGGG